MILAYIFALAGIIFGLYQRSKTKKLKKSFYFFIGTKIELADWMITHPYTKVSSNPVSRSLLCQAILGARDLRRHACRYGYAVIGIEKYIASLKRLSKI